jgi:hypothetical protein
MAWCFLGNVLVSKEAILSHRRSLSPRTSRKLRPSVLPTLRPVNGRLWQDFDASRSDLATWTESGDICQITKGLRTNFRPKAEVGFPRRERFWSDKKNTQSENCGYTKSKNTFINMLLHFAHFRLSEVTQKIPRQA